MARWKMKVDDDESGKIDSLAKFAVEDHNNKKEDTQLNFVKVVSAEKYLVAGWMYIITLEAKDGDGKKVYTAKVWERPWLNFREVTEFKYERDASALQSEERFHELKVFLQNGIQLISQCLFMNGFKK